MVIRDFFSPGNHRDTYAVNAAAPPPPPAGNRNSGECRNNIGKFRNSRTVRCPRETWKTSPKYRGDRTVRPFRGRKFSPSNSFPVPELSHREEERRKKKDGGSPRKLEMHLSRFTRAEESCGPRGTVSPRRLSR